MRKRVAIIAGGQSPEHEISLLSAKSILSAIDQQNYEVIRVGIDKNGRWWRFDRDDWVSNTDDPRAITLNVDGGKELFIGATPGAFLKLGIDVAFPVIHGSTGEDGMLQGLFELTQTPYVGCDVVASGISIDKDITKRLVQQSGIAVAPWELILAPYWQSGEANRLLKQFGGDCFVKPARLGSSIGVSRATDLRSLLSAIETAFQYDRRVIIEQTIRGRELEVAVLGETPRIASVTGEIVTPSGFYSYDAKYLDSEKTQLLAPAKILSNVELRLQKTAITIFDTLGLSGLSRVDFFYSESTDTIFLNEVNTMPGFTAISMYPKLLELSGIPYTELITRLLQLAIQRQLELKRLKRLR